MGLLDFVTKLIDPPKSPVRSSSGPPLLGVPIPPKAKIVRYSVSGEAQVNKDGSRRQRIIRECRVGDELLLVREPRNPYDENAVALFTLNRQQVGYIPMEVSSDVAAELDSGVRAPAFIAKILGGTRDKPNLGLMIDIHWPRPERPPRRRTKSPGALDDHS